MLESSWISNFMHARYDLTTCRIFDIKLAYMNLFKTKNRIGGLLK